MKTMKRISFALLATAGALLFGGVSENFEGFSTGAAVGNGRWSFEGKAESGRHARIVESGDDFYGKVLRLYPAKGVTPANTLNFDFGSPDRVVVEFDMRVHNTQPAFTLALLNRGDAAYAGVKAPERAIFWLMADGSAQTLQLFCGAGGGLGSWRTICPLQLDSWHHVRIVCYMTGPYAETCDIHIDGGAAILQNLPFRNRLLKPGESFMGELYLAGRDADKCGDGDANYYGDVDNLTITAIGGRRTGEDAMAPVRAVPAATAAAALAPMRTRVDFEKAATGPADGIEDFGFGAAKSARNHAQIVECGEEHGKALRIFPSEKTIPNHLAFKAPAQTLSVAAEWDMRYSMDSESESICVAIGPAAGSYEGVFANAAYCWLMVDAANGSLNAYSGGWNTICVFDAEIWHHLKVVAYLAGDKVNTYELFVDGEPKGLFDFRNGVVEGAAPGTFYLEGRQVRGYGDGKAGEYGEVDNIDITVTPASPEDFLPPSARPKVVSSSFFSQALKRRMNYTVLLPVGYDDDPERQWPVLFLFHGRGRNDKSLTSDNQAMKSLAKANFVVAFPNGEDGWYINSPVREQDRYNDYTEEFIARVEKSFRVSRDRTRRGLTGWSMGGYGCTRFAETHADSFGALAPMIGLLDYPRTGLPDGQSYKVAENTFGKDPGQWARDNPINDAASLRETKVLIAAADVAFDRTMNLNFDAKLTELGIDHEFVMVKGGHTFEAVKLCLEKVVDFMNSTIAQ